VNARFGPRSEAAARLLDDLDRLDPGTVAALAAAGGGTTGVADDDPEAAARAELRGRLREIARHAGLLEAVRTIGDEVARWASRPSSFFPAGVGGTLVASEQIEPRIAALPFVLDAAYGTVLEGELTAEELDLLVGPWTEVVGPL